MYVFIELIKLPRDSKKKKNINSNQLESISNPQWMWKTTFLWLK